MKPACLTSGTASVTTATGCVPLTTTHSGRMTTPQTGVSQRCQVDQAEKAARRSAQVTTVNAASVRARHGHRSRGRCALSVSWGDVLPEGRGEALCSLLGRVSTHTHV